VIALRYPPAALRADYLRAGAGAALTLVPLTAVPAGSVAGLILGGVGALFVVFGCRTWLRQRSEVIAADDGLVLTALRARKIAWRDLTGVELRYYATGRGRSHGWMQLTLTSGNTKLCLESTLDRFELIAAAAAAAAGRRGIALSPSTLENLRVLGVASGRAGAACPADVSVNGP